MSKAHRDYFNRLAPEWNDRMGDDARFSRLLKRFGIQRNDFILDVGAGTGRMTRHLSDLVTAEGRIVAQDFAMNMLKAGSADACSPHVFRVCDDVHALACASKVFDKALCFSIFPHLTQPKIALRELHRVLKPDGELLVLHLQGSAALNAFHESLSGIVNRDRLPHSKTMAEWMKETGYQVMEAEETDTIYWVRGKRK